jgi:serine/threonine-protein kinase RsbW
MAHLTSLATDKAATRKDDVVVLVVPADGSYLAVLRTATAGLAARLQFTLDEIEDLRIAVDEASAMLLALLPSRATARAGARGSDPAPPADLTCQFDVTDEMLSIEVAVPVSAPAALPGGQSFSWQVLTALAGEVSANTDNGKVAIRLTKRRGRGG